jgi:hypothetical protein
MLGLVQLHKSSLVHKSLNAEADVHSFLLGNLSRDIFM